MQLQQEETRGLWQVVTLMSAFTVCLVWGVIGVSTLMSDDPVSLRTLVALASCAIAGIGVGVMFGGLGAALAHRRGRSAPSPGAEHSPVAFVLLGLAEIGLGVQQAPHSDSGALIWLSVLLAVGGGFSIGVAACVGSGVFARRHLSPPASTLWP